MTNHIHFDVAIVGAGPAGCACAIQLAKASPQTRIALIDKGDFPKDKICGDALSPDVVNQVKKLSPQLGKRMKGNPLTYPVSGIKVVGHNGLSVVLKAAGMEAYTCTRKDFDNMIFEEAMMHANVQFLGNREVQDIQVQEDRVLVKTEMGEISSVMVVGADGAHSVVARKLGREPIDKNFHAGALRIYYEGIEGFEAGNIEIHFLKEISPGYLWLFPLSDNKANVGLGMLSSHISEKKVNLRQMLQEILQSHPSLKPRFEKAKPLETTKGFGLPLGGLRRNISGNRFLLAGDAASLIDPLSGEGVGNAIRSGRFAGDHILQSLRAKDCSAAFNKSYDARIYKAIFPELATSHWMLRTFSKHPSFMNILMHMTKRAKWVTPAFIGSVFLWYKLKEKLQN